MTTGDTARQPGNTQTLREVMQAIPGVDPVEAAISDKHEQIPTSGFIIDMEVHPRSHWCEVHIGEYAEHEGEAGLVLTHARTWPEDEVSRAWMSLHPVSRLDLTVQKREPEWEKVDPHYGKVSLPQADIHPLTTANALSLFLNSRPFVSMVSSSSSRTNLRSEYNEKVQVAWGVRAVRTREEMAPVLEALARATGLNEDDVQTFTETIVRKLDDMDYWRQRLLEAARQGAALGPRALKAAGVEPLPRRSIFDLRWLHFGR